MEWLDQYSSTLYSPMCVCMCVYGVRTKRDVQRCDADYRQTRLLCHLRTPFLIYLIPGGLEVQPNADKKKKNLNHLRVRNRKIYLNRPAWLPCPFSAHQRRTLSSHANVNKILWLNLYSIYTLALHCGPVLQRVRNHLVKSYTHSFGRWMDTMVHTIVALQSDGLLGPKKPQSKYTNYLLCKKRSVLPSPRDPSHVHNFVCLVTL